MVRFDVFIGLSSTKKILDELDSKATIIAKFMFNFQAFNYSDSFGVWEGTIEKTFVVTILSNTPKTDRILIDEVCSELNVLLAQDCILVTETNSKMKFV